ncbi:TetR/AcrR family transcriptional regulator [Faecalibacillus intestinalis]|uniref:TetR/AcrR family transcriptional regulator n=1 Tax=Faecalibacillus intestinalis TaxID=1982626 RepID=UPI002FDA6245
MTTRDIQREETKKRIYDVAFKLFDEFGYDKVKVSDIAKAANVSVGSVYYHYKNKEAIIDYGYYEFDQMLKEAYEKQSLITKEKLFLFFNRFSN